MPLPIGSLYRMLSRMEDGGLIQTSEPPPDADDSESRRRYYAVTPMGREVMAAEMARLHGVLSAAAERGLIPGGDGP